MADKKKSTEGDSASETKAAGKGAGKEKGAGKKAAAVTPEAVVEPAPEIKPNRKSTKIPKLAKKNKSRLPRREKKAQKKKGL